MRLLSGDFNIESVIMISTIFVDNDDLYVGMFNHRDYLFIDADDANEDADDDDEDDGDRCIDDNDNVDTSGDAGDESL